MTAQTTGTTPQSVSVANNHLLDLTYDALNAQNGFSALAGQAYTAGLTWGGVPNAMVLTSNASGTVVTVTMPKTGFSQTFTGYDRQDVETQIKQFVEKGDPAAFAQLMHTLNQESPLSMIAGNPGAMAETFSMDAYNRYGMSPDFGLEPKATGDKVQIGVDFDGGRISTTAGSASYAAADIYGGFRFTNNLALQLALPMEFRNDDGAASYMVGFQAGLPITILPDKAGNGPFWQLTPWGTIESDYSPDQSIGGLVGGGGATSSFNVRTGFLVWTLADQWSYQSGLPFHFAQYHFDTSANQELVTNGGKLTYNFGKGYYVDAGVSYTDVLDLARVTDYLTVTAGVGAHITPNSGYRLSYDGNVGHRYRDYGGSLNVWWSF